ncbi:MAG: hypothetical protein LBC10_02355, partial [Deltaproteobacteria bacterium]|nr:hypothetical protein [Deltaproteobacteria bacterium]
MTARPAPLRRLNVCLYRRGVRQALLRRVLRFQITACLALLGLSLILGLIAQPAAACIFWIGVGALLSVWHFFSLTKIAPQFMVGRYTAAMGVAFFLRSQGRLLGTVAVLGVAVV